MFHKGPAESKFMVIPAEPPCALLHMGSQFTGAVGKIECQGVAGILGARPGKQLAGYLVLDINGLWAMWARGNFR